MTNKTRMALTTTLVVASALTVPVVACATQQAPRINTDIQVPRSAQDETGPVRELDTPPRTRSIYRDQTPSHPEAARTTTYRTTATVNIRERASTRSQRLGQIRKGQRIEVDQVNGDWLHVRDRGWISARYARPV